MTLLEAVERAREYNLIYEFISWYMHYKRMLRPTTEAIEHALYEWDLI